MVNDGYTIRKLMEPAVGCQKAIYLLRVVLGFWAANCTWVIDHFGDSRAMIRRSKYGAH